MAQHDVRPDAVGVRGERVQRGDRRTQLEHAQLGPAGHRDGVGVDRGAVGQVAHELGVAGGVAGRAHAGRSVGGVTSTVPPSRMRHIR